MKLSASVCIPGSGSRVWLPFPAEYGYRADILFLSTLNVEYISALRSISYCIRLYVSVQYLRTDTVRSTEVRYYSVHTMMISLSPTYIHKKLCTFHLGYNDVSLPQSQIAVSKLPLYPESYTEGPGIIYSIVLYPDARIVKPARG